MRIEDLHPCLLVMSQLCYYYINPHYRAASLPIVLMYNGLIDPLYLRFFSLPASQPSSPLTVSIIFVPSPEVRVQKFRAKKIEVKEKIYRLLLLKIKRFAFNAFHFFFCFLLLYIAPKKYKIIKL